MATRSLSSRRRFGPPKGPVFLEPPRLKKVQEPLQLFTHQGNLFIANMSSPGALRLRDPRGREIEPRRGQWHVIGNNWSIYHPSRGEWQRVSFDGNKLTLASSYSGESAPVGVKSWTQITAGEAAARTARKARDEERMQRREARLKAGRESETVGEVVSRVSTPTPSLPPAEAADFVLPNIFFKNVFHPSHEDVARSHAKLSVIGGKLFVHGVEGKVQAARPGAEPRELDEEEGFQLTDGSEFHIGKTRFHVENFRIENNVPFLRVQVHPPGGVENVKDFKIFGEEFDQPVLIGNSQSANIRLFAPGQQRRSLVPVAPATPPSLPKGGPTAPARPGRLKRGLTVIQGGLSLVGTKVAKWREERVKTREEKIKGKDLGRAPTISPEGAGEPAWAEVAPAEAAVVVAEAAEKAAVKEKKEKKPGWLARWKQKREEAKEAREAAREPGKLAKWWVGRREAFVDVSGRAGGIIRGKWTAGKGKAREWAGGLAGISVAKLKSTRTAVEKAAAAVRGRYGKAIASVSQRTAMLREKYKGWKEARNRVVEHKENAFLDFEYLTLKTDDAGRLVLTDTSTVGTNITPPGGSTRNTISMLRPRFASAKGAEAFLEVGSVFEVGTNAFQVESFAPNESVVVLGVAGPVKGKKFTLNLKKQKEVSIGLGPHNDIILTAPRRLLIEKAVEAFNELKLLNLGAKLRAKPELMVALHKLLEKVQRTNQELDLVSDFKDAERFLSAASRSDIKKALAEASSRLQKEGPVVALGALATKAPRERRELSPAEPFQEVPTQVVSAPQPPAAPPDEPDEFADTTEIPPERTRRGLAPRPFEGAPTLAEFLRGHRLALDFHHGVRRGEITQRELDDVEAKLRTITTHFGTFPSDQKTTLLKAAVQALNKGGPARAFYQLSQSISRAHAKLMRS